MGSEEELVIVEPPELKVSDGLVVEEDAWELVEDGREEVVAVTDPPTEQAPLEAHVDVEVAEEEHGKGDEAPPDEEGHELTPEDLHGASSESEDEQAEEEEGEDDATEGSATDDEINSTTGEGSADESDEKPSCTEELKNAYDDLCARNIQRLQKAKEINADLNAKACLALGEWKPKFIQAYCDATAAAADCCAAAQEQAEQATDKIKEVLADMETVPDQSAATVLTPAVIVAALLVAVLSWLASSAGVAEVAPHNHVHMETLTLLEREMGRVEPTSHQHRHVHVPQVPSGVGTKKNWTRSKKNRTRGDLAASSIAQTILGKTANYHLRPHEPAPAPINGTYSLPGQKSQRPLNTSRTAGSSQETALVHTATLQAEGWIAMDQRIGCYTYANTGSKQLVLRSDSELYLSQPQESLTAKLNSSMLALGDGTVWPTIPLPSSPTIRPPISMPPIAVPMPPADSTISMPPVAISLGHVHASPWFRGDDHLTAAPVLRVEAGGLRVDAAPYLDEVVDFFLSDDDYMDYAWKMTGWNLTRGSSF